MSELARRLKGAWAVLVDSSEGEAGRPPTHQQTNWVARTCFGAVVVLGGALIAKEHKLVVGWTLDRYEDITLELLPPEKQARLLRVRRWRQALSPQAEAAWVTAGVMDPGLRSLMPASYSPVLEQELMAAQEGGPAVQPKELIWMRTSSGWTLVPAILDAGRQAGLAIPHALATALNIRHGSQVTYSVGGVEFQDTLSVLPEPQPIEGGADGDPEAAAVRVAAYVVIPRDRTVQGLQADQGFAIV